MAELEQPIIIKKVYKVEGGHHGGSWKVAYADFVTAMMAFFLLLWLLSSASDGQLEGIAEYFTPTIGLADALGIGFDGGKSDQTEEGNKQNNESRPNIITGAPPEGVKPKDPKKKAVVESEAGEDMLFENMANAMSQMTASDPTLSELADNVMMIPTPEGLKIEIMDTEKDPMFFPSQTNLTDAGKRLLAATEQLLQGMPNHISITGHTDAVPFNRRKNYSNWELSSERANAARRFLLEQGMIEERVVKIQGRADKELLFPEDPKNSKNRRIEILLLRGDHIAIPLSDRPEAMGANPLNTPDKSTLEFEEKNQDMQDKDALENKEINTDNFQPYSVVPDAPIKQEPETVKPSEFVPY